MTRSPSSSPILVRTTSSDYLFTPSTPSKSHSSKPRDTHDAPVTGKETECAEDIVSHAHTGARNGDIEPKQNHIQRDSDTATIAPAQTITRIEAESLTKVDLNSLTATPRPELPSFDASPPQPNSPFHDLPQISQHLEAPSASAKFLTDALPIQTVPSAVELPASPLFEDELVQPLQSSSPIRSKVANSAVHTTLQPPKVISPPPIFSQSTPPKQASPQMSRHVIVDHVISSPPSTAESQKSELRSHAAEDADRTFAENYVSPAQERSTRNAKKRAYYKIHQDYVDPWRMKKRMPDLEKDMRKYVRDTRDVDQDYIPSLNAPSHDQYNEEDEDARIERHIQRALRKEQNVVRKKHIQRPKAPKISLESDDDERINLKTYRVHRKKRRKTVITNFNQYSSDEEDSNRELYIRRVIRAKKIKQNLWKVQTERNDAQPMEFRFLKILHRNMHKHRKKMRPLTLPRIHIEPIPAEVTDPLALSTTHNENKQIKQILAELKNASSDLVRSQPVNLRPNLHANGSKMQGADIQRALNRLPIKTYGARLLSDQLRSTGDQYYNPHSRSFLPKTSPRRYPAYYDDSSAILELAKAHILDSDNLPLVVHPMADEPVFDSRDVTTSKFRIIAPDDFDLLKQIWKPLPDYLFYAGSYIGLGRLNHLRESSSNVRSAAPSRDFQQLMLLLSTDSIPLIARESSAHTAQNLTNFLRDISDALEHDLAHLGAAEDFKLRIALYRQIDKILEAMIYRSVDDQLRWLFAMYRLEWTCRLSLMRNGITTLYDSAISDDRIQEFCLDPQIVELWHRHSFIPVLTSTWEALQSCMTEQNLLMCIDKLSHAQVEFRQSWIHTWFWIVKIFDVLSGNLTFGLEWWSFFEGTCLSSKFDNHCDYPSVVFLKVVISQKFQQYDLSGAHRITTSCPSGWEIVMNVYESLNHCGQAISTKLKLLYCYYFSLAWDISGYMVEKILDFGKQLATPERETSKPLIWHDFPVWMTSDQNYVNSPDIPLDEEPYSICLRICYRFMQTFTASFDKSQKNRVKRLRSTLSSVPTSLYFEPGAFRGSTNQSVMDVRNAALSLILLCLLDRAIGASVNNAPSYMSQLERILDTNSIDSLTRQITFNASLRIIEIISAREDSVDMKPQLYDKAIAVLNKAVVALGAAVVDIANQSALSTATYEQKQVRITVRASLEKSVKSLFVSLQHIWTRQYPIEAARTTWLGSNEEILIDFGWIRLLEPNAHCTTYIKERILNHFNFILQCRERVMHNIEALKPQEPIPHVAPEMSHEAIYSDNNEFDDEFGTFYPDLSHIELEDPAVTQQRAVHQAAYNAFKRSDGTLRVKYNKAYDSLVLLLQFRVTVNPNKGDPRWISDDFFLSIIQTIVDLGVMLLSESWLSAAKLMRDCGMTDWTVSSDLKYSRSNRIRLLLTYERLWDKDVGRPMVKHQDLMLVWLYGLVDFKLVDDTEGRISAFELDAHRAYLKVCEIMEEAGIIVAAQFQGRTTWSSSYDVFDQFVRAANSWDQVGPEPEYRKFLRGMPAIMERIYRDLTPDEQSMYINHKKTLLTILERGNIVMT